MKLIISNKPYSPWPFRTWLLMRVCGIPFEEDIVDLSRPDKATVLKAASPSGRVPVLVDGDIRIWESSAITEYLAERFPDAGIWPKRVAERAHARSITEEMHGGFTALRGRCIMNMRREPKAIDLADSVRKDVDRIVEIWTETRVRFGSGGDFLYGEFCAADAAYAPIISRFHSYDIAVPQDALNYMEAVRALPAWGEWLEGCRVDRWFNEKTDSIS